jgi:hypothetical protein
VPDFIRVLFALLRGRMRAAAAQEADVERGHDLRVRPFGLQPRSTTRCSQISMCACEEGQSVAIRTLQPVLSCSDFVQAFHDARDTGVAPPCDPFHARL